MMKKHPAIAFIEFSSIPLGLVATDALIKKAPIGLLKSGIMAGGRYLTLMGGTTASVDEAFEEGLFHGGESVVDSVFLPDVHPGLYAGLLGARAAAGEGALGIVETQTVSCNVRAAELALKGTPVDLVGIRLVDSWLSGKGVSLYRGELHDVEAAIDLAMAYLEAKGRPVQSRIIPAPHEHLATQIAGSFFFQEAALLELEGEDESC